jgi:hypothetical protein
VTAAYGLPADLANEQILEKLIAFNQGRAAASAQSVKLRCQAIAQRRH